MILAIALFTSAVTLRLPLFASQDFDEFYSEGLVRPSAQFFESSQGKIVRSVVVLPFAYNKKVDIPKIRDARKHRNHH